MKYAENKSLYEWTIWVIVITIITINWQSIQKWTYKEFNVSGIYKEESVYIPGEAVEQYNGEAYYYHHGATMKQAIFHPSLKDISKKHKIDIILNIIKWLFIVIPLLYLIRKDNMNRRKISANY